MDQRGEDHRSKHGVRRVLAFMIIGSACLWMSAALADNLPPPPSIAGVGSRYLEITPGSWGDDVALQVIGFFCIPWGSPQPCPGVPCPIVDCVGSYVQANGVLGPEPFYQSVDDWGTVYARGAEIVPDAVYTARAVDPQSGAGPAVGLAKTYKWGDTDGNCVVNFLDIVCVLDAFKGIFTEVCTPQSADLVATFDPCAAPDGVVNMMDISWVVDIFQGAPFPCDDPCQE